MLKGTYGLFNNNPAGGLLGELQPGTDADDDLYEMARCDGDRDYDPIEVDLRLTDGNDFDRHHRRGVPAPGPRSGATQPTAEHHCTWIVRLATTDSLRASNIYESLRRTSTEHRTRFTRSAPTRCRYHVTEPRFQ